MNQDTKTPIIIVGCPRSGTLLASRILGGHDDHFLITEHTKKRRVCPEDTSGVEDSWLWWNGFEFEGWDRKRIPPPTELPLYNVQNIFRLRDLYMLLAGDKRLVLKNPSHLARIPILKEMFPNALFVFCIRNPWHTIQSMIVRGNASFLLRTSKCLKLPDDLVLRAAASWSEAIAIYLQEKDRNWTVVKYESLVADPRKTIGELFAFAGISGPEYLDRVVSLPKERPHNYYLIKQLVSKSKYRQLAFEHVESGCRIFPYSARPDHLESSMFKFYLRRMRHISWNRRDNV